jgi:hypothetical protein
MYLSRTRGSNSIRNHHRCNIKQIAPLYLPLTRRNIPSPNLKHPTSQHQSLARVRDIHEASHTSLILHDTFAADIELSKKRGEDDFQLQSGEVTTRTDVGAAAEAVALFAVEEEDPVSCVP